MDKKVKIKEEYPLSDDIASQNPQQLFYESVTINTNKYDVSLDDDCAVPIKTEIKLETPFVKEIKPETVTCSNNWVINCETEIKQQTLISHHGPQKEADCLSDDPDCLSDDPVMQGQKYKSKHEMDNKIEIKEEPCYMETAAPSVCDDIKDEYFPPVKSSRLLSETFSGAISGKSSLTSAEVQGRDTTLCNGMENHEARRAHQCKTCNRSFAHLCNLKRHNLVHEGKKVYQCKTGNKSFTQLSNLKEHNLHEVKKPYQCKTCNKSYTRLSYLKIHYWVHDVKTPYQCKTCNKRFPQLCKLKAHNLTHEGKKRFQCETCEKSFTWLLDLKRHKLIHEGKKPFKCETCNKCFTRLPDLRSHNLIHEGKKPFQCKTCNKSFAHLSNLKRHTLSHEGKKPYQCKTCNKSFTRLSSLKRHHLIHEDQKQ